MRIYITSSTAGRGGGWLNGNLRHFDKYIEKELLNSGFTSSFDQLKLTLSYPPLYTLPGVVGIEKQFFSFYEKFPYSRLDRRFKTIQIVLQSPEFSEHFDKEEQSQYKHTFDIPRQYKNLTNVELAQILIDKFFKAGQLIKDKLKKDDRFDLSLFQKTLASVKDKISTHLLNETSTEQAAILKNDKIGNAEKTRNLRQKVNKPKNKLIRDIRLLFTYEIPVTLFYLNRYADIVLSRLVNKEFMCPGYHHLYIRIANTREEALENIVIAEDWYTYGIAILPGTILLNANDEKQQALVLNAIKEGLFDIADMDKLDKHKITEAINEAKDIGVLGEVILKTKENNKIAFIISTKTILRKNTDEIYFTIVDKENNKQVKWKFGIENIFLIMGWFGTINVTNKKITIKPRANMDLVLKGKQKIIELDVEKELANR